MAAPRGIRNNNPGNIDRNATKWQGMAADQSGDPRFVVFTEAKYGIRALAKVLLTYQERHGLKTIRGIVNRWAPPVENDTGAYVNAVAEACGVGPDNEVEVDSVDVMLPLARAIIHHENGGHFYSDAQILEGLYLAGISDAAPPLPPATTYVTGAGGGAGGGGGGGAAQVIVPPASRPAAPEAAAREVTSPAKSTTVWGAGLAGATPLVLAAGPFVLMKLGMDQNTATQTAIALAMLLSGGGAHMTLVGRADANIKPLGRA